ncbi:MAG: hypothetical protein QM757_46465 [Paludibaculum sp.]
MDIVLVPLFEGQNHGETGSVGLPEKPAQHFGASDLNRLRAQALEAEVQFVRCVPNRFGVEFAHGGLHAFLNLGKGIGRAI